MRKWPIANATSRVDVGDRLRFLVHVRCSRKESSRSLSHLLMSFLFKQLLLKNCMVDFVEICNFCTRKTIIKAARGYLILIRFVVVIVISILASLFLEHSV